MASVYKPNDKKHWYISYIDPNSKKIKNRSTELKATASNKEKALELLAELEDALSNQREYYSNHNIKRASNC